MKRRKKFIYTILSAITIACLTIVGTRAFSNRHEAAASMITVGADVNVDLVEELWDSTYGPGGAQNITPGDMIVKDPTIISYSDSVDCYIRIRLVIEDMLHRRLAKIEKINAIWGMLQDELDNNPDFALDYNYSDSDSGIRFYNYVGNNGIFTAGDRKTLFNEVKVPPDYIYGDFQIVIRAEAIYSDGFMDMGHAFKELNSITMKPTPGPAIKPPALNMDNHFAYMVGYPEKTFMQEAHMTRAEATAMFTRLIVESIEINETYTNSHNDVYPGKWYYNIIGYMQHFDIIKGYPDGSFRPDAPITRAEFAAIACKFDKLATGYEIAFLDVPNSHWARDFIAFAAAKGWVIGYPDGTFKPENYITRAEVVTVTNKMLERYCDKIFVDTRLSEIVHFVDLDNKHWAYYQIMESANAHVYLKHEKSETWSRTIHVNPMR